MVVISADGKAVALTPVQLKGGTAFAEGLVTFQAHSFAVVEVTKTPPGKTTPITFEVAVHAPGTAIIPFLRRKHFWNSDKIMMVKEWHHTDPGPGTTYYGLPGGTYNAKKHANMVDVVRQELSEETGLRIRRMLYLGSKRSAPGWAFSENHLYLVEVDREADPQKLDPAEAVRLFPVSKRQLREILDNPDKYPMSEGHAGRLNNLLRRWHHYSSLLRQQPLEPSVSA